MPNSVKGPEADELRSRQIVSEFAGGHGMLDRLGVPRLIDGLGGHEYTLVERITIFAGRCGSEIGSDNCTAPSGITSATVGESAAAAALSNAVYEACHLFEELQAAGRLTGNAYQMRKEVAGHASELVRARWRDLADVPSYDARVA